MEKKYYTVERSQQIVLSLLKAHGIHKVIASPGTTNITLVGSMENDPWFEIYSSVDERSAAYLACGLAAESGEPVVLSCTGATASRNYLPGLTEAYYRKLPVIAITATQGQHRIGHLVAQVIDRSRMQKDVAVMSVDIPVCRNSDDEWFCMLQVNKALLATRHHGGGPVHINLATGYSRDFSVQELPSVRVIDRIVAGERFPDMTKGRVAVFVGSHKSWTAAEEAALDAFCAAHDAVVFCDHTSGYRGRYRVQFALVAGQESYHSPLLDVDLLIHVGEVSGDYYSLAVRCKECWRVSEDGELRDTFRRLRYVFEMPERAFFEHYAAGGGNGHTAYLEACRMEYREMYEQIPDLPFGNIWAAYRMAGKLPANSVLHLGILNTLRSWNFFDVPASVRSYCNVGGFGIDGDMSTLIGASLADRDRLYFGVLGDLAFFYDLNVLGNRHVGRNVRIMLVNNGRGTEFSNYDHPGHAFGKDADKFIAAAGHYGNKSPMLVRHFAEDLGFEYLTAHDKAGFDKAVERFLQPEMTDKPMLFELFTDSDDESNALKAIRSIKTDATVMMKNKVRQTVKGILGDAGVEVVKKILRR